MRQAGRSARGPAPPTRARRTGRAGAPRPDRRVCGRPKVRQTSRPPTRTGTTRCEPFREHIVCPGLVSPGPRLLRPGACAMLAAQRASRARTPAAEMPDMPTVYIAWRQPRSFCACGQIHRPSPRHRRSPGRRAQDAPARAAHGRRHRSGTAGLAGGDRIRAAHRAVIYAYNAGGAPAGRHGRAVVHRPGGRTLAPETARRGRQHLSFVLVSC